MTHMTKVYSSATRAASALQPTAGIGGADINQRFFTIQAIQFFYHARSCPRINSHLVGNVFDVKI